MGSARLNFNQKIIWRNTINKKFANVIENRISNFSKDDRLDKEIMNFETRLNELNLTKARLETEIDTLPYDVKYRDKKLNDLNLRLEKMYDADCGSRRVYRERTG